MKLLLIVCLTCALLNTAESLDCHVCGNENCSNSTVVTCPIFSVCRSITTLRRAGVFTSVTVSKNCSTLLSCFTPLNTETEWSFNQGFIKEANRQLCCSTDNCNLRNLAIPNSLTNGKQCPGCASMAESLNGTCNATVSCEGVEDRCFSGTRTSNTTQSLLRGCTTNNLCGIQAIFGALFGGDIAVTCGAPCSLSMSAVLLTFAVTAHRVLL